MNSTNLSASLDEQSLLLLSQMAPPSIFWVLFGLVAFTGNVTLLALVAKNPQLQSGFYYCSVHLFAADACYGLACAVVGAKRLVHYLWQFPETCTPAFCFPFLFTMFLFENASPAQSLCISVDRLLAVAFPMRYPQVPLWMLQMMNDQLGIQTTDDAEDGL